MSASINIVEIKMGDAGEYAKELLKEVNETKSMAISRLKMLFGALLAAGTLIAWIVSQEDRVHQIIQNAFQSLPGWFWTMLATISAICIFFMLMLFLIVLFSPFASVSTSARGRWGPQFVKLLDHPILEKATKCDWIRKLEVELARRTIFLQTADILIYFIGLVIVAATVVPLIFAVNFSI